MSKYAACSEFWVGRALYWWKFVPAGGSVCSTCNVTETCVDGYGALFFIMAKWRNMSTMDGNVCGIDAINKEVRHIKSGLLNIICGFHLNFSFGLLYVHQIQRDCNQQYIEYVNTAMQDIWSYFKTWSRILIKYKRI